MTTFAVNIKVYSFLKTKPSPAESIYQRANTSATHKIKFYEKREAHIIQDLLNERKPYFFSFTPVHELFDIVPCIEVEK